MIATLPALTPTTAAASAMRDTRDADAGFAALLENTTRREPDRAGARDAARAQPAAAHQAAKRAERQRDKTRGDKTKGRSAPPHAALLALTPPAVPGAGAQANAPLADRGDSDAAPPGIQAGPWPADQTARWPEGQAGRWPEAQAGQPLAARTALLPPSSDAPEGAAAAIVGGDADSAALSEQAQLSAASGDGTFPTLMGQARLSAASGDGTSAALTGPTRLSGDSGDGTFLALTGQARLSAASDGTSPAGMQQAHRTAGGGSPASMQQAHPLHDAPSALSPDDASALAAAPAAALPLLKGSAQPHSESRPLHGIGLASASTLPTPQADPTAARERAQETEVLSEPAGSPAWQQALGERLACFARNGVQHAELRLHPAELGALQINLQLKNAQAQLHVVAGNHQVRAAIEAAMPHLRASLAQAGIALGQSSVGAESSSRHAPDQPPRSPQPPVAALESQEDRAAQAQPANNATRAPCYRRGINTFA